MICILRVCLLISLAAGTALPTATLPLPPSILKANNRINSIKKHASDMKAWHKDQVQRISKRARRTVAQSHSFQNPTAAAAGTPWKPLRRLDGHEDSECTNCTKKECESPCEAAHKEEAPVVPDDDCFNCGKEKCETPCQKEIEQAEKEAPVYIHFCGSKCYGNVVSAAETQAAIDATCPDEMCTTTTTTTTTTTEFVMDPNLNYSDPLVQAELTAKMMAPYVDALMETIWMHKLLGICDELANIFGESTPETLVESCNNAELPAACQGGDLEMVKITLQGMLGMGGDMSHSGENMSHSGENMSHSGENMSHSREEKVPSPTEYFDSICAMCSPCMKEVMCIMRGGCDDQCGDVDLMLHCDALCKSDCRADEKILKLFSPSSDDMEGDDEGSHDHEEGRNESSKDHDHDHEREVECVGDPPKEKSDEKSFGEEMKLTCAAYKPERATPTPPPAPGSTPAPPTPRPTASTAAPTTLPTAAPTAPARIQEVTVEVSTADLTAEKITEKIESSNAALKSVADNEVKGSQTVVASNIVVQLKYDFAVQCDKIPTPDDHAKSFAAALGVDPSAVTVTTETQGCRRLLANGERHLQSSPSQTVTSDVTYPETEATQATQTATSLDTTFADTLATKLTENSGITVAPPTVNTPPKVELDQVMVVTPPEGEAVPEPIQADKIMAAVPEAVAVAVVTANPTSAPTLSPPTPAPTLVPTTPEPTPVPTSAPEVSLAKGPRTGAALCLLAALAAAFAA